MRQPTRVIDSHVHVWTYQAPWMTWLNDRPQNWDVIRRDISWDELRLELDAAGVGETILMQACPDPAETLMLLELANEHPSAVGVVGWASLRSREAVERDLALFDAFGPNKLVGIRTLNGWHPDGDILGRPGMLEACRVLAERRLPLDIFVSDGSELVHVEAVVDSVPEGRYVIDHLGRPVIGDPEKFKLWAEALRRLAQRPNVVVKYSGWATFAGRVRADDVRPFIGHVLDTFGPARIMFASNWPVALVVGSYAATYAATLQAVDQLSTEELDRLMYRTAADFYLGGRGAA